MAKVKNPMTVVQSGAIEPYIEYTYEVDSSDNELKIKTADMHGYTVIPYRCFYDQGFMTSVQLPTSSTSIGDYAFQKCTNLALTVLPEGLTSIGDYAFSGCTNLALTSLPSGATSIGDYAFQNCTNLALTTLPSGLTSIGANAFSGCTNLALTTLPSGLTSIWNYAFQNCTNLALTTLPSGLTSISNNAFQNCTSLQNIEIACSTLGTGTKIFNGCTGLEKVWFRSSCTKVTASSAANAPFAGCSTSMEIYCEEDFKPSGYGTYFNRTGASGGTPVTVVYGQTTRPW